MRLPEEFVNRMNQYWSESGSVSGEGFYESFDKEALKGVRFSIAKTSRDSHKSLLENLGEDFTPVPWCSVGYYTASESSGKDPYYHAGVYYPQEPSAMLPAQVINAQKGDIILDMCAAPGGKATRIGENLQEAGLLVANEINYDRSKALLRNVERMGIRNAVILNETPDRIATVLPEFFDKIIIDAPCSGEGMFRRDPQAVKSWEKYGPSSCVPIQKEILEASDKALKPGGEIVYSTCTYCVDEDEGVILDFIKEHGNYEVIRHPEIEGITHEGDGDRLPGAMRIWPHVSDGDGHFCVHLKKAGELVKGFRDPRPEPKYRKRKEGTYTFTKSTSIMTKFLADIMTEDFMAIFKELCSNYMIMHGMGIYILPVNEKFFEGLKTVKTGWFVGEIKQTSTDKIFVPSNSFPLTVTRSEIKDNSYLSLARDDERLIRYLKGETINLTSDEISTLKKKGTVIIGVEEFPIGMGKITGPMIKNMYPKAWRMT